MSKLVGYLVAIAIGIFIGWLIWRGGGGFGPPPNPSMKEVKVDRDSAYTYHIPPGQKTRHLSRGNHDFAVWTFPTDATVDSVVAYFAGTSPFSSHRFQFADSAAYSGQPVVGAGPTLYNYTVTVYPHGHAPVTVDPGIIIDM